MEEWLCHMELGQYTNNFINEGFDVKTLIEDMKPNEELLKEVGLRKEGHIIRVLVKIEIDVGSLNLKETEPWR